jgi:hypothetical protein
VSEQAERAAWLAAVARGLDAAPDVEAEVLAELAAHLDDEAADLSALGLDPAEAELRALAGMGDPGRMGRDLGRARRTARSALALAGGGAFTLAFATVATYVMTLAIITLAAGLSVTIGGLVISTSWAWAPDAYAGFAAASVGLTWAACIATSSVLARSAWPGRTVRAAMAGGILAVGLPAVLLFPGLELDTPVAVLLLLVPMVGAASALVTPREPLVSYRPGRRTLVVALAVVLLPALLWPPASGVRVPPTDPDLAAVGRTREATQAAGIAVPQSSFASVEGLADGSRREVIRFDDLAGWTGLTREVWALTARPDGTWAVAADPLVVAPFELEGRTASVRYAYPAPRERRAWVVEGTTGIAPDGVRSLLEPWLPAEADPWRGSVLDWFSGR